MERRVAGRAAVTRKAGCSVPGDGLEDPVRPDPPDETGGPLAKHQASVGLPYHPADLGQGYILCGNTRPDLAAGKRIHEHLRPKGGGAEAENQKLDNATRGSFRHGR
jgi:hypothetical protein